MMENNSTPSPDPVPEASPIAFLDLLEIVVLPLLALAGKRLV